MKISHCIDMMYSYTDFENRISEAKKFGADAIEFWKWSNKNIDLIKEYDIPVSIFNLDSKKEQLSYDLSRGILNDGRCDELLFALEESIPVYKKLGASAMILLVGEHSEPNPDNVIKCLEAVKGIAESENVTLIVEPLNNIDRQGYSMPYAAQIFDIIRKVGSPNIKILYDIYHQHMMGDFLLTEVLKNIDIIGHFHVADCPGRHEPGTGKIDYAEILSAINRSGYEGYFGLEYRSTVPDGETFGFLESIRR